MDLRALLALPTVIAGTLAALGRGAQRSTIDDRGGRLAPVACRQTQHRAQIVDQRLKASCRQPTLRLLVRSRPGRKVVRHPSPRRARLHDVAKPVEHLAQVVLALAGILALQQQVRRGQRPLLRADVKRIRLAAKCSSSTG
jgi:hypothetical protein